MRRLLLVLALAGCRVSIDTPVSDAEVVGRGCSIGQSTSCVGSVGKQDFTWIWQNILSNNCLGSSCHQAGATGKAKETPYDDKVKAYTSLVNLPSHVNPDPSVILVVPGQPAKSYLRVMLGDLKASEFSPPTTPPPSDVGLMPQAGSSLCCQKLDAIDAWIMAGAPND